MKDVCFRRYRLLLLDAAPTPTAVAAPPGTFHPHLASKVLAKISPNPSMTPLTNGRARLIANEVMRAIVLERFDSLLSNTDKEADGGGSIFAGAGRVFFSAGTLDLIFSGIFSDLGGSSGEALCEGSGKESEDCIDETSSQCELCSNPCDAGGEFASPATTEANEDVYGFS